MYLWEKMKSFKRKFHFKSEKLPVLSLHNTMYLFLRFSSLLSLVAWKDIMKGYSTLVTSYYYCKKLLGVYQIDTLSIFNRVFFFLSTLQALTAHTVHAGHL